MGSDWSENPARGRGVAAVVVTYHPDASVAENLKDLRPQVDWLIVVDNGSSDEEIECIDTAAMLGVELIRNGENLGIATALNIAVKHALERNMEWVFLFDQDSRVEPGFVKKMLVAFAASTWGERLAILTPQYRDTRSGKLITAKRVREGLEIAMTSGSLLRAETFLRHGLFREELFVDAVDHEYSLRLRKAGRVLEETSSATLVHALGAPAAHRLFRRKPFYTANYSPSRRYYQERNKVWMARHYGRSFPRFILNRFQMSAVDFVKILFFEERRWEKMRFFLRGVVNGLRGRMGKFEERAPSERKTR